MDNTICFKSNYFWLTLAILVIAIAFIIYKVYDKYQQIHTIVGKMSDNIKDIYNSSKNSPTPPNQQEKEIQEEIDYTRDSTGNLNFPTRRPILNYDLPILNMPNYGNLRYSNFQLVGYVHKRRNPDQMFRLMCRQINTGRYEYYVIHPQTDIKIPINVKNDWELNTGDVVSIPGFHGHYNVKIYDESNPF